MMRSVTSVLHAGALVWLVAVPALGSGGCSPSDVLSQQGANLSNMNYAQLAVDEKRRRDDENRARAAREQSSKDAEAARARAAAEEVERHVRAGQASLDLGEYDAAVVEWKEAYKLSNDPAHLLKVATATRMTGECEQAAMLYKEYQNKVPAESKTVQPKLAEAQSCQKAVGGNAEKVRAIYAAGRTHYDLSEYDQAAEKFKEAYRLSRDASYLFNIAQAYRLGKKCSEAETFYRRYAAASPDSEHAAKATSFADQMKACK